MPTEDHDEEYTSARIAAAKESHGAIDDAVRQHLVDMGITGLSTGWVLIAAITDFEEETELDGMFQTASDGLSKWAKIGLMTIALSQETTEDFF